MSRRRALRWAGLAFAVVILAGCSEVEIVSSEHTIETIDFETKDERSTAHIETETEILVPRLSQIEFVTTEAGADMKVLIETETGDQAAIDRFLYDNTDNYTVFIPEDQLKDISRKYAETYQKTLKHVSEKEYIKSKETE